MRHAFEPSPGAPGFGVSNVNPLMVACLLASLRTLAAAGGMKAARAKSMLLTGFMERRLHAAGLTTPREASGEAGPCYEFASRGPNTEWGGGLKACKPSAHWCCTHKRLSACRWKEGWGLKACTSWATAWCYTRKRLTACRWKQGGPRRRVRVERIRIYPHSIARNSHAPAFPLPLNPPARPHRLAALPLWCDHRLPQTQPAKAASSSSACSPLPHPTDSNLNHSPPAPTGSLPARCGVAIITPTDATHLAPRRILTPPHLHPHVLLNPAPLSLPQTRCPPVVAS
jgi:hypothetical protein